MRLPLRPRYEVIVYDPRRPDRDAEYRRHSELFWTFAGAHRRAMERESHLAVYIVDLYNFGELVWGRHGNGARSTGSGDSWPDSVRVGA